MDALIEQPLYLYAALALVTVWLPASRTRALAATGLGAMALGIAADGVGGAASGTTFATTNEILIGLGAAIVVLAAILAWRARGRTARVTESTAAFSFDPLLWAGLLLAALGPHLILVSAGVFMALVAATATTLRGRRARWIGLIAVAAVTLAVGLYLLFTILGPGGGRVAELSAGPFSPSGERLLAILLGLGSLFLAGMFPVHRAPWRLSLVPLAAILLARILIPAIPEGLADWQAPAMLWLVVTIAVSAWRGRWPEALAAGGLMALWSGRPDGVQPGVLLVLLAWLADAALLPPAGLAPLWWGVVALAAPFALTASLSSQVVLSVAAVAALVTGFGRQVGGRPQPR